MKTFSPTHLELFFFQLSTAFYIIQEFPSQAKVDIWKREKLPFVQLSHTMKIFRITSPCPFILKHLSMAAQVILISKCPLRRPGRLPALWNHWPNHPLSISTYDLWSLLGYKSLKDKRLSLLSILKCESHTTSSAIKIQSWMNYNIPILYSRKSTGFIGQESYLTSLIQHVLNGNKIG